MLSLVTNIFPGSFFFLNFTAIGFSLGRVCTVYSSFAFVYFCLGFYRFSFRFFIYDYIVVEHIPFKKKQFFGHIGRYTDREKIKQIHTHTKKKIVIMCKFGREKRRETGCSFHFYPIYGILFSLSLS